jgi:hypothetical protein
MWRLRLTYECQEKLVQNEQNRFDKAPWSAYYSDYDVWAPAPEP